MQNRPLVKGKLSSREIVDEDQARDSRVRVEFGMRHAGWRRRDESVVRNSSLKRATLAPQKSNLLHIVAKLV
jgi:hypothetical protein